MSLGHDHLPGDRIRAKLDHPVIDADAHVVECEFAINDFIVQIGGTEALEKSRQRFKTLPYGDTRTIWWGAPSGKHSADRAAAHLPRYLRSRLDETGIDFAMCYSTNGINGLYIPDDELRQITCRALNTLSADMFRDVRDRLCPVAVIPTYTPQEAIAELEHAVITLGHRAVMIGTEIRRPYAQVMREAPHLAKYAQEVRSIAFDSPHDYDPFWARCEALKVAPVCHTPMRGMPYRDSPTNYVFNHLGGFANGAEFFCRSLFMGGVTRRFPNLSFGFLEGGAHWAVALLNDLMEHWEKRNLAALKENLDPARLDVDLLERLFDEFGTTYLTGKRIRAQPTGRISRGIDPDTMDEFRHVDMTKAADLKTLFAQNFYFGCEADDRASTIAFNRRLNPIGVKLNAMFGSDIGHWDVMDIRSVLAEAYELVETNLLSEADFRDFAFANPARLHLTVNPDFFRGTVVEQAVAGLVRPRVKRD
ncbi:MAG: amidohydrolase [Betaproteobacteria bacterium]|nr:amidohydrolase [Betaproteobacteria bacterium]